jgi:clan AA aspartic protease
MGLVKSTVELINLSDKYLAQAGHLKPEQVRRMPVSIMVDSGAVMLAINETIKNQLGLSVTEIQSFSLADGQIVQLEVVSGLEVRFKNRWCVTNAIVLKGDTEPLLGAVPMELMDLVISPFDQTLDVNPKHPIKPQHILAGVRH